MSEPTNGAHNPPTTTTTLVDGATTTVPAPAPNDDELAKVLERLIAGTDLPAAGATTFSSDAVYESAVAGVRRAGDATPVELSDKFSIGSNAKAMTVTLVASFVEEGLIGWDTTIADVFAGAVPRIDPTWSPITIRQLLSHTSGLDDDSMLPSLFLLDETAPVTAQRLEVVDTVTSLALQRPPGDYAYSNIGYTIVGAMLEELTGSAWEELIQARLFDVLGMDSCGFYAPGTPGEIDQPWGHLDELGGQPMDPGDPEADFPHVIAPAGMVHCNMADWVVFLQSQLRGFQGGTSEIIGPDSFDAIRTRPHGSDYALGWLVTDKPSGRATFYHHGSNQRFTTEVWLVPAADWGLITVTNIGEIIADPHLQRVGQAMFERSAP